MTVGRWMLRHCSWAGISAGVAGVAAWAALTDDKRGWTVVAAAVAAVTGAFGPAVADRVAMARERRHHRAAASADVRVADLPASVTWLLRSDQQVVPFFGRSRLLRQLDSWMADEAALAVRLLIGAGGVGKSRLAREIAVQRGVRSPQGRQRNQRSHRPHRGRRELLRGACR